MNAISQARLVDVPMAGVFPILVDVANDYLELWRHRLGAVHRPFRQEAFAFEMQGRIVSIAVSGSIVSSSVAGYDRQEVIELTRLCSAPDCGWASRIMIRLWREVCAPAWACWPVKAAVSYSHNAMHRGDLYRFDGWHKVREDCGNSGGGAWTRKRCATDSVLGKKTLWLWEYPPEAAS